MLLSAAGSLALAADQHSADGNVTLGESSTQADIDALAGVTEITGDLHIERLGFDPDFSPFDDLKAIGGSVRILINPSLTSIGGFNSLESVGQNDECFGQCPFEITRNSAVTSIEGFNNLKTVGGLFTLSSLGALTSIGGFDSLETVRWNFEISNANALTSIGGFNSLASVGRDFIISENNDLASIEGFNNLKTLGHEADPEDPAGLIIEDNPSLTSIGGFDSLETVRVFAIARNDALPSIGGFDSLASVERFHIDGNASLTSIGGFDGLETVGLRFFIGDDPYNFDLVWFDNPLLASIDGFYNLAWGAAGEDWTVQEVTYMCPSFELTTATDPSCVEP